jgi:hypothetical protein
LIKNFAGYKSVIAFNGCIADHLWINLANPYNENSRKSTN